MTFANALYHWGLFVGLVCPNSAAMGTPKLAQAIQHFQISPGGRLADAKPNAELLNSYAALGIYQLSDLIMSFGFKEIIVCVHLCVFLRLLQPDTST